MTTNAKRRADSIREVTDALRSVLLALEPLDFGERIKVIRWACDHYGIARVALYQGDGTFKAQT